MGEAGNGRRNSHIHMENSQAKAAELFFVFEKLTFLANSDNYHFSLNSLVLRLLLKKKKYIFTHFNLKALPEWCLKLFMAFKGWKAEVHPVPLWSILPFHY